MRTHLDARVCLFFPLYLRMAAVPAPAPAPAAPAPRPWPRVVTQPLPRFGAPYTLGEDVIALPPGALTDVLDCLETCDTGELRLVCRDAEAHVAGHRWADVSTPVTDLVVWRQCFPRALAARLNPEVRMREHDAQYLAGLQELDVGGFPADFFTPAVLTALGRVPTLRLHGCGAATLLTLLTDVGVLPSISGAAFDALSAFPPEALGEDDAEALVAALLERPEDPRVCEAVCLALASACHHDEENCDDVIELGASEAVAAAMQHHSAESAVAAAGCKAIAAVAGRCNFKPLRGVVNRGISTSAVRDVMAAFHDNATVIAAGCAAVASLCRLDAAHPTLAAARPLVAAALRNHAHNPALCVATLSGFGALNTAGGEELNAGVGHFVNGIHELDDGGVLVEHGGVQLVLSTMRAHPADPDVMAAGGNALNAVMVMHSDYRAAAAALGAIPLLLEALQTYKDNEDVLQGCCWALSRLAMEDEGEPAPRRSQVLVEAGVVEAVLAAMARHETSVSVAGGGLRVLQALIFGSMADAVVSAGAIAVVVAAMWAHQKLLSSGCSTLWQLASHHPHLATSIVDAGGHQVILDALRRRYYDDILRDGSCDALRALVAASPTCADAVVAAGGLEALVAVLRTNDGYFSPIKILCVLYATLGRSNKYVQRALTAGVFEEVAGLINAGVVKGDTKWLWLERLRGLCIAFPDVHEAVGRGSGLPGPAVQ